MTRHEIVLAALAPGRGHRYTPVQVQKLMFLIDRQIGPRIGGPHFNFRPYNYGPFDRTVYLELEALANNERVDMHGQGSFRTYALTPEGQAEGDAILAQVEDVTTRTFITRASEFVRAHNFSTLVAAIYKAYPEMRANSVFQG